MRFSIIIPVYNVQNYLKQCVDSVLSQDYHDYEIILIDDGSTDQSGVIVDAYAKNNCNVSAIHQKNGGLSAARNAGLDMCTGDFVIFLDSDDYLSNNSLKTIDKITEKFFPDIIAGYGIRFSSKGEMTEGVPFRKGMEEPISGKRFFKNALYQDRLSAAAQYYIYKRSFLEKNHLRFKKGLLHEDELWTPIVLYHATTVVDLKFRYYCYRCDNATSITRDPLKQQKRARDRKVIAEELAAYFADIKETDANAFHDNISAQYMYAVYSGGKENELEISRSFPIRNARTLKYIMKSLLFYLSPKLACRMRALREAMKKCVIKKA